MNKMNQSYQIFRDKLNINIFMTSQAGTNVFTYGSLMYP